MAGEPAWPEPEQLLQMALDELEQRGVTRLPRPVDPATDLHTPNQAGGRVAGTNHGQTDRPLPPAVSPISGADRVHTAACESNSLAGPGDPRCRGSKGARPTDSAIDHNVTIVFHPA